MNKTQEVAEALAQFLGPHTYDQTPKDKADLFKQNRGRALSQEFKHSQEDLIEMAKAAIAAIVPEGSVVVPRKATKGLLMSMAVRYDHGLGCPGYYDQTILRTKSGITHAQRLSGTLREMEQIHEEVVGAGFYAPDKESRYTAMIKASEDQTHE